MKNYNKTKKSFESEEIEKYFYSKDFGETITFKELQKFTHFNLEDEYEGYKFKANVMRRVKNRLIENGYVVKSIRNVGYYILRPNQVQSYSYRTYIIKPLKSFEKAKIILMNTKKSNLNKKELVKHKLTEELNEELNNQTRDLLNSQKYNKLKVE